MDPFHKIVGLVQRRGIVHAVARHTHHVVTGSLEGVDHAKLVLWDDLCNGVC